MKSLQTNIAVQASMIFVYMVNVNKISLCHKPSLLPKQKVLLAIESHFSFATKRLRKNVLYNIRQKKNKDYLHLVVTLNYLS